MDSNCSEHNLKIINVNEQGKPQCEICLLAANQVVAEYQGKKKALLKKKKVDLLEKLRQSKKKMVEIQEMLQIQMNSHIEILTQRREALNCYFQKEEENIDQFKGQEADFVNFKSQGNIFREENNKDSTFTKVQEELEIISILEQQFEDILEKAINNYINNVGSILQRRHQHQGQQQQQQQQQNRQQALQQQENQLITELIQFVDFDSYTNKASFDQIVFNYDNTIIATSDGFEIKFLKIGDEQLFKIDNSIEDDDMELIQCILFSNLNNDLYYGTDGGKLKVWKYENEKWSNHQSLDAHKGKGIVDLKFNQDESLLFSAGEDKTIQIWSKQYNKWNKGDILKHDEFSQMCSIAYNLNTNFLISVSFSKIKIWNLSNYKNNQEKVIEGLEPNKSNKVYFIDDNMFFVTNSEKFYFYQQNEEQNFIQLQNEIMPKDKKYKIPFCYNPSLKILLVQSDQDGSIDIFRFKGNKFELQSSIQGVYKKLQIASDAEFVMLTQKSDQNILKVMKLSS